MRKRIFLCVVAALLIAATALPVFAYPPTRSYIYNAVGDPVPAPPAYTFSREVTGEGLGIGQFNEPEDMYVSQVDDFIYIADTNNNRLVILDGNQKVYAVYESLKYKGETLTFDKPKGVFVYEYDGQNKIYFCDTQNNRIILLDRDGVVENVFTAPTIDLLKETVTYYPEKLVVDRAGRMFVIGRSINRGLIKLTPDGEFESFFGAPKVTYNALEMFWNLFLTQAQKDKRPKNVPTEYSNVFIDNRGFIHCTIANIDRMKLLNTFFGADLKKQKSVQADRAAVAPIRKLAADGTDIMIRLGVNPPVGDLSVYSRSAADSANAGFSMLVDICVDDNDLVTVVDRQRAKFFMYDVDGNLISVTGNDGTQKGTFKSPRAVAYMGEQIVVLDSVNSNIVFMMPTDYGRALVLAISAYKNGNYVESEENWKEVLKLNSNMSLAYTGSGRSKLREGDYKGAMADFEVSKNYTYYSNALELYMNQIFGRSFIYIFMGIILVFIGLWVFRTVKRFRRFLREGVKKVL